MDNYKTLIIHAIDLDEFDKQIFTTDLQGSPKLMTDKEIKELKKSYTVGFENPFRRN